MILRDRIIEHEGLRLKPYKCSMGYLTIGVGRNLETNGISKQEAMMLLDNDMERCKADVARNMPWSLDLDDMRKGVLVEMVFQLGIGRVMLFKKMISALREHNYEAAANEVLTSAWHKQTPKRCETLARIMREGK